jgi:hypothetical protein
MIKTCENCKQEFNARRSKIKFCSHKCRAATMPPPLQRGKVFSSSARELTIPDAAYIAGLLDGEGSIVKVYSNNRKNYSTRVTIVNTYKPVIDWLLETTGCGTIIFSERRSRNEKHADAYVWQCYSANAKNILEQIFPYLIIKKDKAQDVLEQQYE